MKEITIYECEDGSRFDKKEDALNYDNLCGRIKQIMAPMGERTDECKKGSVYLSHDPLAVKNALKSFLIECSKVKPYFSKDLIACANGIRHISQAEHLIRDSGISVLCDTMFRFSCTNMISGREYQQPYYAKNEDEFLEIQKKYYNN